MRLFVRVFVSLMSCFVLCVECYTWLMKKRQDLLIDTKVQVQISGTPMETSKILGCKEECCSSVSGWTMYLGSSANENDNDDDDDDHDTYEQGHTCQRENRRNHDDDDDANNKSDDSMASDASSGPSHQELPWRSSKLSLDKHATSKDSWKQKLRKHKTKKDESRIKVERYEQPVLTAKDTTSQGQSRTKVRKSKQTDK